MTVRREQYDDFDASTTAEILAQIIAGSGGYRYLVAEREGKQVVRWAKPNNRAHIFGWVAKYFDCGLFMSPISFSERQRHPRYALGTSTIVEVGRHGHGVIIFAGAGDESVSFRRVDRLYQPTKRDVYRLVPVPRRVDCRPFLDARHLA